MDENQYLFVTTRAVKLRAAVGSCSYQSMPQAMPWDFLLIFLVLALYLPWRGWARLVRLLALPSLSSRQRISLYLSTIAMQWSLAGVIAWRALARGLSSADLAVSFGRPDLLLAVAIGGAAALGTAHWFNLRRIGSSTSTALDQLKAIAYRIFPRSNRELLAFSGLALTAGICEEFIFRGFVLAALLHAGLPPWSAVLISSVLFGLGHAYQGKGGIVGTLLLGTAFGWARIRYDSLFPVIVWHTMIDLVAGIAGRRYLLKHSVS